MRFQPFSGCFAHAGGTILVGNSDVTGRQYIVYQPPGGQSTLAFQEGDPPSPFKQEDGSIITFDGVAAAKAYVEAFDAALIGS
jgi:hypothetical protein